MARTVVRNGVVFARPLRMQAFPIGNQQISGVLSRWGPWAGWLRLGAEARSGDTQIRGQPAGADLFPAAGSEWLLFLWKINKSETSSSPGEAPAAMGPGLAGAEG